MGAYTGGEGYAVVVHGHEAVIESLFDQFPDTRYPVAVLVDALDQQIEWLGKNLVARPSSRALARKGVGERLAATGKPLRRLDDSWGVIALALQQALVGRVTPSLRCIAVQARDAAAQVRFIYEVPVTDSHYDKAAVMKDHWDLVSAVWMDVAADLRGVMATEICSQHLPTSALLTLISEDERWLFMRREEPGEPTGTLRGIG